MNILIGKLLCTFMIVYNSSPSSIKEGKEMVQPNRMTEEVYKHRIQWNSKTSSLGIPQPRFKGK